MLYIYYNNIQTFYYNLQKAVYKQHNTQQNDVHQKQCIWFGVCVYVCIYRNRL